MNDSITLRPVYCNKVSIHKASPVYSIILTVSRINKQ